MLCEHERWDGDLVQRTKDGRALTVSARLQLARGEDGVERVLESDRDMTGRKQTEDALRENEERFRLLVTDVKEAGFDHHLAKPPRLEKLEQMLASLPRARRGSPP